MTHTEKTGFRMEFVIETETEWKDLEHQTYKEV